MKNVYLFPGQGAQHVGMGKDACDGLDVAKDFFGRAEAAIDMDLAKLCFEGPEDDLARTDIAQPAIFTVSAALLACLEEKLSDEQLAEIKPSAMAGLSLGEYTALYAAGAMDFETGVKLVARRGQLMQQAATDTPSSMICILGLDEEKATELAAAAAGDQVLTCANFNCPGQVVLSGQTEACERAAQMAKDFDAKGAVPLKVAGAFHSQLMAPAAKEFASALEAVDFAKPKVPVISNVTGSPYESPDQIAQTLLDQLVSPVRWQQSMEALLADGYEGFYEIGPGRVLAGLMKRIQRRTNFTCINSLDSVQKVAGT